MIWPWSRTEDRAASDSYTDLVVAGLVARASGEAVVASATGAVQTASGLWARCMAALKADVAGVDPALLACIGYDLGIRGESLWLLDVADGRLVLTRAADWTITGGARPETWRYLASLNGPTTTETRTVDADGVVHVRYLPDPRTPWKGVAPWQRVPVLADLAGEVETALLFEARQPVQSILPTPTGTGEEVASRIAAKFRDRRRPVSMPESPVRAFGTGTGAGTCPLPMRSPR